MLSTVTQGIVGKVREKMPQGALLFVVSDHGFQPWRRTMNYNAWLFENGYLVFKGQRDDFADLEDLFLLLTGREARDARGLF
mgnify:CR=1 FL=1